MCPKSLAIIIITFGFVLEPSVSGKYHSIQHRLIQKEITLHTKSICTGHKHWRNSRTIHSEIIISTLSTGNWTSSTFPLMRVILSSKPFSLQVYVNLTKLVVIVKGSFYPRRVGGHGYTVELLLYNPFQVNRNGGEKGHHF